MTKNLKYFFIPLVLSLPFWWGFNIVERNLNDFFFWREMAENPKVLAAQVNQLAFEQNLRELKPLRNNEIPDLDIQAKSAISVFFDSEGKGRILFEKASAQQLPIASLTKLMTAKVVLENYDLSKEITVSKEAVEQEEDLGKLEAGKTFSVEYLLYPLLMESSNDAAFSLANDYPGMTEENFVGLMNSIAQRLGLQNTRFFNSTGLDPKDEKSEEINYSSALDLVFLTQSLSEEPLVWQILSTPKYDLYGPELININKLLSNIPSIVGGKTGYTEKALSCFLLVSEAPKGKGRLVNVILGTANDRFSEMEKLTNWVQEAYNW